MIKKGQLRRWKEYYPDGGTFMTIGCRIVRNGAEHIRSELVSANAHRGTKIWSILQDGQLIEEAHIALERHTEAIDEAR